MPFGLQVSNSENIRGSSSESFCRPPGDLMGKGLEKLIEQNKAAIAKKWYDLTVQTYAADTADFLKSKTDPFANPVGSTTLKGLGAILDQLIHAMEPAALNACLDPIIRIRAVQNFTPSQATAFILSLKKVLRDNLVKELHDSRLAAELVAFESKIDQLCLMAFDIYMQCREKIFQISANETRNRTFRAFERAGLIAETPEGP
jgi:hypothetical protein